MEVQTIPENSVEVLNPEYRVESFSGRTLRHEYLHSEGIIEILGECRRIRVEERDEDVYVDVWEGEYDGQSFEPMSYVDQEILESASKERVPGNLEDFESLLEEMELTY